MAGGFGKRGRGEGFMFLLFYCSLLSSSFSSGGPFHGDSRRSTLAGLFNG